VITSLCLNASIDYTYEVRNFTPGHWHQPARMNVVAGGKGINVARVVRALGHETLVCGFAGGTGAAFIAKDLRRRGILTDFVPIEEEPRRCTNIVDPGARRQTQVDESGPLVTPTEVQKLRKRFSELLGKTRAITISGSVPRGVPNTIYAELIAMAREHRVPVILDARDDLLLEGVKAKPFMVKPNEAELAELAGEPSLVVPGGVVEAAKKLVDTGISLVLCSLGQKGAILVTENSGIWQARPPEVDYVSNVGSGDAMVAAFAVGSVDEVGLEGCLRLAVGAGAANAATLGAAQIERQQILELAQRVELEPIGAPVV